MPTAVSAGGVPDRPISRPASLLPPTDGIPTIYTQKTQFHEDGLNFEKWTSDQCGHASV